MTVLVSYTYLLLKLFMSLIFLRRIGQLDIINLSLMIFLRLVRMYSGNDIYIVLCLLIFRAFLLGEANSGVSLCSAWEKSHYFSYLLTYPIQLNYL